MKINKRLRTLFLSTGLALVSSAVAVGYFADVAAPLADAITDAFNLEPSHAEADWFTLDTDPTEENYTFSLFMSPLPEDYKGISKTSINEFMTGVMDGLKNIATAQIKFILPVDEPPRKENEDWTLKPTDVDPETGTPEENAIRPTVISELVEGVLRASETHQVDEDSVDEFDNTIQNGDQGLSSNTGAFLNTMMSYIAAFGEDGSTINPDRIDNRLGITVDGDGNVEDVSNSAVYDSLYNIYSEMGYEPAACESKAIEDLQVIYDNAVEINGSSTMKTEALVQIFDGLEETSVPVKTVMNILGPQNVLDGVKDIFMNDDVDVSYGKHFLNELNQRTMTDICDIIQLELYDPNTGTGGYTKQDLLDAFEEASNERLMEIFDGLEPNGLNNIRIILGKPVDYDDGGFTPTDPEPVTFRSIKKGLLGSTNQASASDYAKFGSKLMEIIMKRLDIGDLLIGVKNLTIVYEGVRYEILYKVDQEDGTTSNLILGVHAIVDLLNALPKMSEIRDKEDADQRIHFDLELLTALNDRIIEYDDSGVIISDELTPIVYHCDIGFQDKDCKYVRKLAALLDDTFDLEFDFEDDGEFWANLVTRNPQFVSNIYAWLCDSGFITDNEGDSGKAFVVELWDLLFSDLGDIRDYIAGKEVEDVISILKNIDYETGLATITAANKLNAIFNIEGITDSRLERAVELFAKLVKKGANTSYDDIVAFVTDALGEGIGAKLDNETLRSIYEKVQNLLIEIDGRNISIEMLKGITNDSVYGYVEALTGKSDLVLKIRDYIVKAIDLLPEEFLEKSVMDFYVGDGEFKGNGSIEIPWEKLIKSLPGGSNLWITFNGMIPDEALSTERLPERPETFSFDLDCIFEDVYSITYEWNYDEESGEYLDSKVGMLHSYIDPETDMGALLLPDSDVYKFGGITEDDNGPIVHWLDKEADSFTRVDNMPAKDTIVIPEHLFEVSVNSGETTIGTVEEAKVYDGTGTIYVEVDAEYIDEYTCTYQWQKLDEDGETWTDVTDATNDSLDVPNVLDSGTYRCIVKNGDIVINTTDDLEVISPTIVVNIEPAPVDVTVTEWVNEGPFDYTGEDISVEIDSTTVPEGAVFNSYDGTYTAKEVNDEAYTAVAKFDLVDENNYYFVDDIDEITLDWFIKMNVLSFEAEWLDDGAEFLIDGEKHHNTIDPDSLTALAGYEYTITYETKLAGEEHAADDFVSGGQSELGEYITKAVFTFADPSIEIQDGSIPDPAEFTIYMNVDISCLEWSTKTEFTYDGEQHMVFIDNKDHLDHFYPGVFGDITYETTYGEDSSSASNKMINAGEYSTVATLNFNEGYNTNLVHLINDTHNILASTTSSEVATSVASNAKEWKINPKQITLENVVWSDELYPLTYGGYEQVTMIGYADNMEFVDPETMEYSGNANTNAGTYEATFTFESNNPNYVFTNSSVSHAYVINKKEVEVYGVVWGTDGDYSGMLNITYDGNEHYIDIVGGSYSDDETLFKSEYLDKPSATYVGEYSFTKEFSLTEEASANYELVGQTIWSETLLVEQREVMIWNWIWSGNTDIVYDKTDHSGTPILSELTYVTGNDFENVITYDEGDEILTVTYVRPSEAKNAGIYEIVVKFGLVDSYNYKLVGMTETSTGLVITPIEVTSYDIITWTYDDYTYDGLSHNATAAVVSEYESDFTFGYIHNSVNVHEATDVGEYVAAIEVSVVEAEAGNFVITDLGELVNNFTCEWSIVAKDITVSGVTWSNGELTYNREEQSVTATYTVSNNEEQLVVTYTENKATNAGEYEASIAFSLVDSHNYNLIVGDDEELTFEWSIAKKAITVSNVVWEDIERIYNGSEYTVGVEYDIVELTDSDMVNVVVTGNKGTNASDDYQAKIEFSLVDAANYTLSVGTSEPLTFNWSIKKAEVIVSELVWNYVAPYTYSGEEFDVYIITEMPDQVELIYSGDISGVGADEYEAHVIVQIKAEFASNYVLTIDSVTESDLDWVINKKHISIGEVIWTDDSFVYSGEEYEINVVSYDNMDLISIDEVKDNKATIVGKYYAVATFVLNDTNNYILDVNSDSHYFVITKRVISVSNIVWTNGNLVYNSHAQSIELTYDDSSLISAEITGNSATNAGNYVAKVDFSLVDEHNYELIGVTHVEQNWVINKAVIFVSDAIWTDEVTPFVYSGEVQTTVIVDIADEEKINIGYFQNSAENAGNYGATAILSLKDEYVQNYVLNEYTILHEFSIAKAKVAVDNVVWSYDPSNPFMSDKTSKEVVVVSYDNSEFVDYQYVNNDEFTNIGIDPKNYEAKAVFSLKVEFAANYELIGETEYHLNWKIVQGEITLYYTFTSYEDCDNEQNPYSIVTVVTGIEQDPSLFAKLSEGNEFEGLEINFEDIVGGKGEVKYSYDLSFEFEGETYVFEENNFIITIMVPEDIRDGEYVVIVRNADDTVSVVNADITNDGKYAVIRGDSVKNVGFVTKVPHSTKLADNPQSLVIILVAAAGQIVFVIATIICAKKVRKDREKNN